MKGLLMAFKIFDQPPGALFLEVILIGAALFLVEVVKERIKTRMITGK